jgi:hypothetical protein
LALYRLEERITPTDFTIANGDVPTLVAAIKTATVNNQPDRIILATNGTYTFTAPSIADPFTTLPALVLDGGDPNNSLTILGNGSTFQRSTASGTPQFRFLSAYGSASAALNLSITNLTFTNGNAGGAGGAITATDVALTLNGCVFTSDQANSNGGALFATTAAAAPDRAITITNCQFLGGNAGAVFLGGSTNAVVTGSKFNGNSGNGITYNGHGLNVSGSTFGNNGQAIGGGSSGSLSIDSSQFTVNTTGGIILTGGVTPLTITNSTFQSNYGSGTISNRGNSQSTTTIVSCTIANGSTSSSGGAVNSSGVVTIQSSTISGTVTTSRGAAVYAGGGLSIVSSTISGNTASGSGGAVFAGGGLTIASSTISGNSSSSSGGAVYAVGGISLDSVTISGNRASSGGGGIAYKGNNGGSLSIINSTIHGNIAGTGGGGLLFSNSPGSNATGSIVSSTITGNAGSVANGGGGVYVSSGNVLSIGDTVIAENTVSGNGAGSDLSGTYASLDYNLFGMFDGALPISGSIANTLRGTAAAPLAPKLGPLTNNGGPTLTRLPLADSPLRDAGDPAVSNPSLFDQRGSGYARIQYGRIDIGATEYIVPGPPIASGSFADVTAPGGTAYTFQVTYTDATAVDVSTLDSSDIRITAPHGFSQLASFVGVDVNTNGTPRVATYTFTPPGGSWTLEDSTTYTVAVVANQVANTTGSFAAAGTVGTFAVRLPGSFIVSNTNDTGASSLRQALTDANADTADADHFIGFSSLFDTPQTINLETALPTIGRALTLAGPGAANLNVRRDPALPTSAPFRVFQISGNNPFNVTLSGLTISGGLTSNTSDLSGGGISISGPLGVTVQDAVISGNSAFINGGGIYAKSFSNGPVSLTVRNSTISGNVSVSPVSPSGYGGGGAGIFVDYGNLLIENSTISGNTEVGARGTGGGVWLFNHYFRGTGPTWIIRNSTIAGNSAGGRGGGIAISADGTGFPLITIQNCTIANNTAGSTQTGFGGGGIVRIGTAGTLSITSTIIANNANNVAPDLLGTATVNVSLIRNLTGATISGGGNLPAGTDPMLGPLANNGGPTQTMATLAGSPVIDKGSNPAGLITDQRGPGFARVGGGAADIGAYEVQDAGPTVTAVGANNGAAQRSRVTSIQVTFSTVVTIGPGAFTLTYLGGPSGTVGSTVGGLTVSTATVNGVTVATLSGFVGADTSSGSLVDGRYALTVTGNAITANGVSMASDFTYADSGTTSGSQLYRLFGDGDGNRVVNQADLTLFRAAFGSTDPTFDVDGNGAVNQLDLAVFRTNFGAGV